MIWLLLILWLLAEIEMRVPAHRFHESRLPGLLRVNALTLGRHVFVATGQLDTLVMAHERAHVEQFRRYTYPGFFLAHLYYRLRYGYQESPLEVEARALARLVRDQALETKRLQK